MNLAFDAYVTEIVADGGQAAFALGDGAVAWEDGGRIQAHDGAVLAAVAHPAGQGVVTGGDDGRACSPKFHGAGSTPWPPRRLRA
jgi:hypothetical protein